tara:strand:+ start:3184 stop:3417 length:234 start_codon:yes stop_codon:yes gene_type:complete
MSTVILASLGVFTLISVITLLVLVMFLRSSVSELDKSLSELEDAFKIANERVVYLDAEMGALLPWVQNADGVIAWPE